MKILVTEEQLQLINEVRVKSEDRVKLYQDDETLIVAPLTHTVSCKYGSNTPWCVSLPSKTTYFDEYIKHGDLIFVIFKKPNSKEQKFAYYQSFPIESDDDYNSNPDDEFAYVENDDDYTTYNGWYDMTNFQYNAGLKDLTTLSADRLRKFIPDFVFSIIEEYVSRDRHAIEREKSMKLYRFGKEIAHDSDNIPIVLGDRHWYIFYRTKNFGNNYKEYVSKLPNIDPRKTFSVFYINKNARDWYQQNFNLHDAQRTSIRDVRTGQVNNEILGVYQRFFDEIMSSFSVLRKKYNFTNEI